MERSDFIKKLSSGIAVSVFLPAFTFYDSNSQVTMSGGNYDINTGFNPDVDVELTATRNNIQVLSGRKTGVYSYILKLLKAENATVENLPGSWLGPVFRVKQDRIFDGNNQLVYMQSNSMSQMQGFLGDRIAVNGTLENNIQVSKSSYRFRVLNGSNSRIYKLAWSDGSDVIVIGTDGGLLSQPARKPYLMLAPGERIEIWKDFSGMNPEEQVYLQSLPFNDDTSLGMGRGMMGGRMMSGSGPSNGTGFDICTFTITTESGERKSLPSAFQNISSIPVSEAVNTASPRQFRFYNQRMRWVINGETFGMREVADWEKVKLNTTEIWEFINGDNRRGMGMMQDMMKMPHPVHLHGLQFQIIERDVSEVRADSWATIKDGFIDDGWKDTFLLMPGMKVKIALKFEDYTGIYVYHCHNLEHEDMGMMRNYEVVK